MLLRAEGERVNVDASVRRACVVLVRLDQIEVGSFALREAVLSVELELGRDHWVLAPAVHVKSGLREDESTSVRDEAFAVDVRERGTARGRPAIRVRAAPRADAAAASGSRARIGEQTADNEFARRRGARAGERVVRVGESVDAVRVVERLHTERLVKLLTSLELLAAVDEVVLLHREDELLARVVEVELDLVGRRSHRFSASELHLLDEVLMRVLRHAAALVSVKEHVVDVERGSHERLGVGTLRRLHARAGAHPRRRRGTAGHARKAVDGPQEAVKAAEFDVNLNLVVLEGNKRKRETRVAAEPELERHVKGRLRKRAARRARVAGSARVARRVDRGELGVRKVGKLSSLANHLVVATLLLGGHRELVPQVHPVTVLAVDALSTNLHLDVVDHVDTRVVDPAGKGSVAARALVAGVGAGVDLREHHLKVCAVGKVTVARNSALDTATEIGLSIESLLNRFHGKIGVATVRHLPESDLRVARKIDILGAVSYKLH